MQKPARPPTSPIVWALILIAAAKLALHGFLSLNSGGTDFAWVWSNALVWAHGGNPYDLPSGLSAYANSGGAALWPMSDPYGSVYPPSIWPALWPWTHFSLAHASLGWDIVALAMLLAAVVELIRMLRLNWPTALMVLLLVLAFSPVRLALRLAQPGLMAFALTLTALHLALRRRNIVAGVLLGIAFAIKFQLAIPLLIVFLFGRNWRGFWAAIGVVATFFIVGAAGVQISHPGALSLWLHNLHLASLPGSTADVSRASPDRYLMIQLQVPLRALIDSAAITNIIALFISGLLLLKWLRSPADDRETILSLGAIGVISLLPFYHRPYDIVLAIPLMLWAAAELESPAKVSRRPAIVILLIIALFLGPESDVLQSLAAHGRLPLSVTKSAIWGPIVLCWQTWALVALSVFVSANPHARRAPASPQ